MYQQEWSNCYSCILILRVLILNHNLINIWESMNLSKWSMICWLIHETVEKLHIVIMLYIINCQSRNVWKLKALHELFMDLLFLLPIHLWVSGINRMMAIIYTGLVFSFSHFTFYVYLGLAGGGCVSYNKFMFEVH